MKTTVIVILFIHFSVISSGPVDNKNVNVLMPDAFLKNDTNLMKKFRVDVSAVFEDLKKLKNKKSLDEIRHISTVGILAGALKVERDMSESLARLARDFFANFNSSTPEDNMEKLFKLEEIMERDRRAMEILGNALDFAIHSKSYEEYKEDMEQIARMSEITMIELAKKKFSTQMTSVKTNKGEKVGKLLKQSNELNSELAKRKQDVRGSINKHIYTIHSMLKDRETRTIKYLKAAKTNPKPTTRPALDLGLLKNLIQPKPISPSYDSTTDSSTDYTDDDEGYQTFPPSNKPTRLAGLLNRLKRQGDDSEQDKANELDGDLSGEKTGSQSESESGSSEEGPGGLVGLIASLSGGDEGSDVGALIGALTGIVTNLFGPGGLDVPSLIGTATGLLSGLLAGDENFGKVLGSYVAVAVDGFSGGGGAILNGQFVGQFLGTVIAGLSANPEDEDLPLTPTLFIQNLFSGSGQAVSKKAGTAENTEDDCHKKEGGSNIFGFITHVVSSIVGGITSLLLNGSLGSSGGSSTASAELSGGSSSASSSSHPTSYNDQHHH